MTALKAFNYAFQFTGFRVFRNWNEAHKLPPGEPRRVGLMGPVLPLTGWRTDFVPKAPRCYVLWTERK